ncbi:MAG TPA: vWA domain-containing protein [Polyangia bacterium]|nr:vWA domain-containing protein [Polyangia bacterium]
MCMCPRRLRSVLPALLLPYGLVAALGCAGSGKSSTGSGGSSSPGTGGSSSPGSAGTTGVGGTTGSGGTTGVAGTVGSGGSTSPGTGGNSAGGTGGSSAGGTGGSDAGGTGGSTAGTTGSGGAVGVGGTTGTGGTGGICQMIDYTFDPKIPSVFILVDRSGSEFDPSSNGTTGIYYNLRTAVLQVLQQLKNSGTQMRIGIGLFVGDHASGTCQPAFDMTAIDDIAKNYDTIAAKYNSLSFLMPWGAKADTPMSDSIPKVKALLQADTGTGSKYMLVATDGQTDFCDDGNNVCPADAIVYRVQDMFAATPSIGTLVLGLPTDVGGGMAFNMSVLQGLANAGTGQNAAPTGVATQTDVWNQCNGVAPWKAIATTAGRGMNMSLATYTAPAGTAKVFTPASTSTTDLANQLAAAISGVKSCTFDLSNVNGKAIKVDLSKLNQAHVLIQGSDVPLSATDGWNVDSSAPSTLVLSGTACAKWRMPNNTDIQFDFPCGSIIFE